MDEQTSLTLAYMSHAMTIVQMMETVCTYMISLLTTYVIMPPWMGQYALLMGHKLLPVMAMAMVCIIPFG